MFLHAGDKSSVTPKVSALPTGGERYCCRHLHNLVTLLMLNKARELSPEFTRYTEC